MRGELSRLRNQRNASIGGVSPFLGRKIFHFFGATYRLAVAVAGF